MNVTELVDTYCQAWSAADPARRAELLRSVLTDNASYTDPTVDARGQAELLAHITTVIARRPGSRVVRTSLLDIHHNMARFAWRAIEADGKELPEGIDVIFLSPDSTRIERIIGFFGPVKRTAS